MPTTAGRTSTHGRRPVTPPDDLLARSGRRPRSAGVAVGVIVVSGGFEAGLGQHVGLVDQGGVDLAELDLGQGGKDA
jgi:hypothetical protein